MRQLGPGMELTKVYLIHEGTDKEDAAAGAAQTIFRRQRIGNLIRIETRTLVRDGKDQRLPGVFKAHRDLPGGIVLVAVEDCIHRSLAHGHGDVEPLVFVQACFLGQFLRGCFDLADAFHS